MSMMMRGQSQSPMYCVLVVQLAAVVSSVTVMGCPTPASLPLLCAVASAYLLTLQQAVVSTGLVVLSVGALNMNPRNPAVPLACSLATHNSTAVGCSHTPQAFHAQPLCTVHQLSPARTSLPTLSCVPQTAAEDAAPLPPVRGHLLPPVHRRLPAAAPQVSAEPAPALLQALRQPAGAPAAPAGRFAAACPLCMPPCASCCSQQGGCWPLGCTSLATGQLGLRCRVASQKLEQRMALGASLHISRGSCRP